MGAMTVGNEERRLAGRRLRERVLVSAPTGDDAPLIVDVLGREGMDVVALGDLDGLAREWRDGAGALLIASESLNDADCCVLLRQLLEEQEPWSEMPIVLLGGSGEDEAPRVAELLGDRAQLLILERPLGVTTFVSAVEGALRSRRRQYQVKRLLDELAASAAAITRAHEETDRAKDEFLATLAHELRSPMTAIRGWIQLLQTGVLGSAEAAEALSMIEAGTKAQAHIVEDLLDMSRILAGKAMIEPAVIELIPVVTNVVATFRPAAAVEGIQLTASVAGEPLLVFADETRLQQVGWNLLSNAIKFTPRGGSVHVTLAREEGNAVLRVRDTGQGISPELLPNVFDRYRQEEGTGGQAHAGLGLGLAIVRHLVESHGGTIRALSEGLGRGAELVVSLPLYAV
jgi:signal transduction histidine kinase